MADARETGERLGSAIAVRIAPWLPSGLQVSQDSGTLWITDGVRSSGTPLSAILEPSVFFVPDGRPGINPIEAPIEAPTDDAADARSSEVDVDEVHSSIVVAATNALSRLQDFVSESLATPWPDDPHAASSRSLPQIEVEWTGRTLSIWFGDADDPVLALPPIPEEELLTDLGAVP